ncbi:hypothetical protein ACFOZ1_02390 [Gracilibacillus marinus]|uniref:Gfo/Idh/MocA-like oxidoreductase N-terminal domain-containing protein n=1 Tax=Gracilibacillus marinus TaxID=630535 RepID=A0ABV8VR27_9BACI
MKICLIGSEKNSKLHALYLQTLPGVEVETIVVETQQDIQSIHLATDIDFIDLCVEEEQLEDTLKKIGKGDKILLTEEISQSNFLKNTIMKNSMIRFSTKMMALPELKSLGEQVRQSKLGKLGVQTISLKSQQHVPVYQSFSYSEISLLHWVVATLGNFQSVYAMEQNQRYLTVQIRMEDGSYVHFECAREFGIDELSIELTGLEGMLSYHDREATPLRLTNNQGEESAFRPYGEPILKRQLADALYIQANGEPFANIQEWMNTFELIDAISQSIVKGKQQFNRGRCDA